MLTNIVGHDHSDVVVQTVFAETYFPNVEGESELTHLKCCILVTYLCVCAHRQTDNDLIIS